MKEGLGKNIIDQLREYLEIELGDSKVQIAEQFSPSLCTTGARNVFVVHGRDNEAKESTAEIPESGKVEQFVKIHCDELSSADVIIIVHPNWWGQAPAILKGWIDRVFRPGIAYRFDEGDGGEGIPIGLLNASSAVVINTSNTPAEREHIAFGDPLESIWRRCIFDLCGVTNFHRRIFSVIVTSTIEQRVDWIEESKKLCRTAMQLSAHNNPSHSDRNSAALRSCR
jgi:NAD(P)H dehydrogenase (quinone)